jgi:hypothetical protein
MENLGREFYIKRAKESTRLINIAYDYIKKFHNECEGHDEEMVGLYNSDEEVKSAADGMEEASFKLSGE